MEFQKYKKVKRFGTPEVENINNGKCYIFPKLDGTNGSLWYSYLNGIEAGSRNRKLSLENDNGGFYKWSTENLNIKNFFKFYPDLRLFGEWLIPHTFKNYTKDAWNKFYIFDVYDNLEKRFLTYEEYLPIIKKFNLDYIPVLCKIDNPSFEELLEISKDNNFLVTEGIGEGIVIKRYDYENKHGRLEFAKIITDEFKNKKKKKTNKQYNETELIEEKIVNQFCTNAFIRKEYNKFLLNLKNENKKWENKYCSILLFTIYEELLKEEIINFVHKFKKPTINFKILNILCINKIKEELTEIF